MDYSFVEAYKKARAQKPGDSQADPSTRQSTTQSTGQQTGVFTGTSAPVAAPKGPQDVVIEPWEEGQKPAEPVSEPTAPQPSPLPPAQPAVQAAPVPSDLPSFPDLPNNPNPQAPDIAKAPSFLQKDQPVAADTVALPKTTVVKTAKKKSGFLGNVGSILGNRLFLMTIIAIGLVTVAILALSLYTKNRPQFLGGKNANQATEAERQKVLGQEQQLADQYLEEVGKIIALPKDEKPLGVAAITDRNKLQHDQPFFNNAKNGDVIIIYSNRAILYDPTSKVIVDIAPVNVENEQSTPVTATTSALPQP